MIKHLLLIIFVVMTFSISTFAQRTTDIEGSKDYPTISRFEGAFIEFYKETKWGTYKIPVDEKGNINFNNPLIIKGRIIRIQYSVPVDNNPEYVLHNYTKAFEAAGHTVMLSAANEQLGVKDRSQDWNARYYGPGDAFFSNALNNGKYGLKHHIPNWKAEQAFIVANGENDGKQIYVTVYAVNHDKYTLINQDVIEVEAPKTGMVTVDKISKGIETEGHVALDGILFETGKSVIKPESLSALKIISEYINTHNDKKFFIVGHTDNTGDFGSNMTLSKERAKSVITELTTKYSVKADQLEAYGVSSLSPVSSNNSDEGKTKNRRVEIVEQ